MNQDKNELLGQLIEVYQKFLKMSYTDGLPAVRRFGPDIIDIAGKLQHACSCTLCEHFPRSAISRLSPPHLLGPSSRAKSWGTYSAHVPNVSSRHVPQQIRLPVCAFARNHIERICFSLKGRIDVERVRLV